MTSGTVVPVSLSASERGVLVSATECPSCRSEAIPRVTEHRLTERETIFQVGLLRPGESLFYRLCEECGLVFTDPRPTSAALESYYATVCPQNEHLWAPGDVSQAVRRRGEIRFRRLTARVLRLAPRGRSVADVGGGTGESLRGFVEAGWSATLIEPGARVRGHSLGVEPVYSVEELVRRSRQFDVVLSLQTLEHLAEPSGTLRAILGCLAPGGLIYLEVPYETEVLGAALAGEVRTGEFHAEHINFFSQMSLRSLVRGLGLSVISIERELVPCLHGWTPSLLMIARRGPPEESGALVPPIAARAALRQELASQKPRQLLDRINRRVLRMRGLG